MKFALAVAIAVQFWGDRGVEVPCTPVAVPGADAQIGTDVTGWTTPMATTSGCRILLSRGGGWQRIYEPEWYCANVVHEVGHLAGIGHNRSGLMTDGHMEWEDVPVECAQWKRSARRLGFSARPAHRVAGSGS